MTILGSAAGGGLPQWNCGCANCVGARAGRLPCRRVSCAAVCAGDDWLLINASCDLSAQCAAQPALWPRGVREAPLHTLLLTDGNVDHTAGLLELRHAAQLTIYSTAVVKETLCAWPVVAQIAQRFSWRTFEVDRQPVPVLDQGGLRVFAIPVPGLLPSYAGARPCPGAVVAYRFEHRGATAVYAPVFLELDERLRDELDGADAMFLDGTFWTDDEMVALGLALRTARQMGHAPMSGPGGSLERARTIGATHRYYTHVNNSNPVLDPASSAAQELAGSGFSICSDGLELTLDGDEVSGAG